MRDQFHRHGERGAARRFGENTFGGGEQLDRVDDFRVGRDVAPSAGFPHRLQHVEAVGRVADRDRLRNRVRFHRRDQVGSFMQCVDDRGGPGGLCAMDFEFALAQ